MNEKFLSVWLMCCYLIRFEKLWKTQIWLYFSFIFASFETPDTPWSEWIVKWNNFGQKYQCERIFHFRPIFKKSAQEIVCQPGMKKRDGQWFRAFFKQMEENENRFRNLVTFIIVRFSCSKTVCLAGLWIMLLHHKYHVLNFLVILTLKQNMEIIFC